MSVFPYICSLLRIKQLTNPPIYSGPPSESLPKGTWNVGSLQCQNQITKISLKYFQLLIPKSWVCFDHVQDETNCEAPKFALLTCSLWAMGV